MILRHRLHATIVRAPNKDGASCAEGQVTWADGHCATEKVMRVALVGSTVGQVIKFFGGRGGRTAYFMRPCILQR
jgi:hypothetical protein